MLENDLLEAIVALPEQLFYNTGIASYIWALSNRKSDARRGKVQLIDARDLWVKMRKSLGEKRRAVSDVQGRRDRPVARRPRGDRRGARSDASRAGGDRGRCPHRPHQRPPTRPCTGAEGARRPLPRPRPQADVVRDARGRVTPDPDRRDSENIPLDEHVEAYLDREVRPYVPGAWCPDPEGKIGYEIPFTRLFYRYTPPRPSAEIKAELKELESEIHRLLAEVVG